MRTLSVGCFGSDVRTLGRRINRALGFPYVPNSALFSETTKFELQRAQLRLSDRLFNNRLDPDGIFGPKTAEAFDQYENRLLPFQILKDPIRVHSGLIDLRDGSEPRLAQGYMDLKQLRGVTLHQTGCQFGDCSEDRLRKVNSTFLIRKNGNAYLLHDPRMFIWHAQGLSYFTLGIEIEGNYEGLRGFTSTLWRPDIAGGPDNPISRRLNAGAELVFNYLRDLFFKNEIQWERIHAHRQSHASRPWDPGEGLWKAIGQFWARRLCLPSAHTGRDSIPAGAQFGSGQDIHKLWR